MLVYRPQPRESGAGDGVDEARALGFPRAVAARARLAVPADGGPHVTEVTVAAVALCDALPVLLAGPERVLPPWRRTPDSLVTWSRAARLGVAAVARKLLVPTLARTPDGQVTGVWRALVDADPPSRALADRLAAAMPPAAHATAVSASHVHRPEALLGRFLDAVADLCGRGTEPQASRPRPRQRLLPWTARWVEALADPVDARVPLGDDAEELLAGVASWLGRGGGARLELALHAPDVADGTWRLTFGLRDEHGRLLPAARVWAGDVAAGEHDPAQLQEALLAGLGRCARAFDPVDAALAEPAPEGIDLDLDHAWVFAEEVAPLLAAADIGVTLPDELTSERLRLRLRVGAPEPDGAGDEPSEERRLDGPADVSWEVTLDGEPLPADSLEALLAGGRPLLLAGGRWVHVDPDLARYVEALADASVPLSEGLLHVLAGSVPLATLAGDDEPTAGPEVEVVGDGRIARLVARLASGERLVGDDAGDGRRLPPVTPPGFSGELRPYQRRGVAWLAGMGAIGFGAVLADAMGLGKTIQLIAYLLDRGGDGPHLVVCPTSVVGNWERELGRFAPGLEVTRFHGPERPARLDDVRGVVVTSYGLMRRDPGAVLAIDWDVVTLDEAQHVKNPRTAGARAVRTLRSSQTVALTGTPLENRLSELWSVLDVTNPGLLGTRARFGRRFAAPIEQRHDAATAARLRRVVGPFVLRREKHDVLADLPEKIEREVPCTLTAEQAELYERAVARALGDGGDLEAASPMQRRGRVLALLTALKQICNHPGQYLHEDPRAAAGNLLGRSGKLAATREIVAEATAAGDQVLVFTQFVEMGRLLVAQLSADLGTDVPFLHGGVTAPGRDRMVAAFQGEAGDAPPLLVVSLRAGGTGLNLTAATHVLHYDRWWNPAVEDQATDRAHRIGQSRTVEVHKLVTAGTVEERIGAMLERKRSLADAVVGSGEQWITELDADELADLVALGAPGEELDEDDPFEELRWTDALDEAS